jgi:hypothetical protein
MHSEAITSLYEEYGQIAQAEYICALQTKDEEKSVVMLSVLSELS